MSIIQTNWSAIQNILPMPGVSELVTGVISTIFISFIIYVSRFWIGQIISILIAPFTPRSVRGEWDTTFYKGGKFLFSWDKTPGIDSGRLIDFLKQDYGVEWVETAKVEKIDGKTIKVSTEKNCLCLKLNDEKKKVNLTINDGRTDEINDEFIVEMEKDKPEIYRGKTYNEIATVYQFRHWVWGTIEYEKENKGKKIKRTYKFSGTLCCNILTATYEVIKQHAAFDRGTFSLQLDNTGEYMKGAYSWTDDEKMVILGGRYEWQKRIYSTK